MKFQRFAQIGAEQRRNPASRALRIAIYGKRGFDSYALVSAEDGQDVTSGDDEVILALVVHLGAAVLGVQHLVADLDVDRDTLAGVVTTARADSQDFALLRLLLGIVRNEQTGSGLGLGFRLLDDDLVFLRCE